MIQSEIVQKAYDAMAQAYQLHRDTLHTQKYVTKLLKELSKQSSILDIGCGSGDPVSGQLISAGHLVTGIDISPKQIALAHKLFPTGNFLVADMLTLKPQNYRVDAIVSLYALFHVPREKHQEMLRVWSTFLPHHGWLLVSMGDTDFEGFHDLCGERVWSSHYGPAINRELLGNAGFEIDFEALDTSGNERHQIVLAQKK
jgi:ubiquinone/menaquinone biosynthesis C-methylase UbiE